MIKADQKRGVWSAAPTPFTSDGRVDERSVGRMIEHRYPNRIAMPQHAQLLQRFCRLDGRRREEGMSFGTWRVLARGCLRTENNYEFPHPLRGSARRFVWSRLGEFGF